METWPWKSWTYSHGTYEVCFHRDSGGEERITVIRHIPPVRVVTYQGPFAATLRKAYGCDSSPERREEGLNDATFFEILSDPTPAAAYLRFKLESTNET